VKREQKKVAKGRMTEASIAVIVAEIEAYGRGEREAKLSWAQLEKFSGFSHVALWQRSRLKLRSSA